MTTQVWVSLTLIVYKCEWAPQPIASIHVTVSEPHRITQVWVRYILSLCRERVKIQARGYGEFPYAILWHNHMELCELRRSHFSTNFEPYFLLVGLELVSIRSYTWRQCKRHSLAIRMSYMYICHCLQVQVWLSATFAMTLRGGGEGVQGLTS